MKRTLYSGVGLLLVGLLFLAFNLLSSLLLRDQQFDLTQQKLYTFSAGTQEVLDSLDEPLNLYLFFSKSRASDLPALRNYARRVEEVLDLYARRSHGNVRLFVIDPLPFSDDEDRAARFGLQCVIYMGTTDIDRQQANVFRMKLLGAEVIPVTAGTGTLKDAMNEALRDWVTNVDSTFYLIGTVAGPHPYPAMVRDFQAVIGKEPREQLAEKEGRLPDSLVACIGGGSNAMGLFHPFLDDAGVQIVGVEAAGHGIDTGKHAASLNGGVPGVLHGNRTFLLQDADGQIIDAHSISAGLDYPGIGPEHAWLHDTGRVEYTSITDDEALEAFHTCCRLEGIIPALESSHALAEVFKRAPSLPKEHIMVVNLSGRGDKDMQTVMHHMQQESKA